MKLDAFFDKQKHSLYQTVTFFLFGSAANSGRYVINKNINYHVTLPLTHL